MVRVHPCLPAHDKPLEPNPVEAERLTPLSAMSQVTVTLPDGSARAMPAGARVRDVAESISPRLASAALAGVVDGRLVDLGFPIEKDASVRIVTEKSPEALPLYRHSAAHLLAAAVTTLFPDVQCGIGPATDEGFYYDFVVPRARLERPAVQSFRELLEQSATRQVLADLGFHPADES